MAEKQEARPAPSDTAPRRLTARIVAATVVLGELALFLFARFSPTYYTLEADGPGFVRGVMLAALPLLLLAGYLTARWRDLGWKGIRRGVQLGFLALFVMLFVAAAFPMYSYLVPDLFLRADPLAAGSAVVGGDAELARLWPSLVVIALTLLLGRVFCGWICPLGTCIDLSDHLLFRRVRPRKRVLWPQLKYYVLAASLVAAAFSLQLAHLFDPIPLLTRALALVLYPIVTLAQSAGVSGAARVGEALTNLGLGPVGRGLSALRGTEASPVYLGHNLLVLALFVGLLALSAYGRRFWCRNLCGLGALLGLLGRYGLLKRRVNQNCTRCLRCHIECKMSAIPQEVEGTALRECILCWDCVHACPHDANPIVLTPQPSAPKDDLAFGLTRRRLVAAMAAGLGLAMAAKATPARAHRSQRLLRPPGALPVMSEAGLTPRPFDEVDFLETCVRCGECMKACPTNAIQPALAEAGWEGFWTPVLVPKIGYCEHNCNLCGTVCPTGALRFFYIAEKARLIIGTANINRNTCIAWYEDRDCLACNEACSYQAVPFQYLPMDREGGPVWHRRPVVDEGKCTGCGQCEKACPVKPEAAIVVFGKERKQ